jgi:hypothetical protein
LHVVEYGSLKLHPCSSHGPLFMFGT